MPDERAPVEIFYSYAHEDGSLRKQLEIHLSLLRRQGLISEWHDRKIIAGTEWERQINEHLESASLILLLISPDFLASDYCYDIEMQRALERHDQNKARVIPIILRPCDWQRALFAHLQALPDDGQAVTEWTNQDAAFRNITGGIRTAIEQFPSNPTQQQPLSIASRASATARTRMPAVPTDRNRQRMLKRVQATWITGVLEQSLHGAALIALGLEEKTDALDNPWRLLMQEVDRPVQMLPEGTRITEVYNETEGGLLILGEPGAGKTTLLLELARDLLDHAQTSETTPIPVVFNLSSWAKKRLALSDWLVEELRVRYDVPHKLGKSWVNEDQLLLLLDGLDEVALAARKDCIEAINNYWQRHPDVQVVVCSRSAEYLNSPVQLRLHTAVVVQPLTQEQIDTYLESLEEQARTLHEALQRDEDLRELATTPLMLTVLLFAFKGTSPDKISELTTLEAKREQIFASYVQHMLKRRGFLQRYKPEQITHWLTYLARQMKRQNQTLFYIEQMQPDWLPKLRQRLVYRAFAGTLLGGLLSALVSLGLLFLNGLYMLDPLLVLISSFSNFLLPIGGGGIGLIVGLLYRKSTEIRTADVITWSWVNVCRATITSIVSWLIGSLSYLAMYLLSSHSSLASYEIAVLLLILISILTGGTCSTLIAWFSHRSPRKYKLSVSKREVWYALRGGALIGAISSLVNLAVFPLCSRILNLIVSPNLESVLDYIHAYIALVVIGCIMGSIIGIFCGVSTGQLEMQNTFRPNQGIWRSARNSGRFLLIIGSIVMPICGIIWILSSEGQILYDDLFLLLPAQNILNLVIVTLIGGGIAGLLIGAFFGLLNGGTACIKHVLLRVFLWRTKSIPWNYARFLDYAAERIFLRKVGGGYIFIHRLLLEYFASLEEEQDPRKVGAIECKRDVLV